MSWQVLRDAMWNAIVSASGLPAAQVIWSFQNSDEPALSYISMKLTPISTIGLDWLKKTPVPIWLGSTLYAVGFTVLNDNGKRYVCITAGTSAATGGPTGSGANITDGNVHWSFAAVSQELSVKVQGVREAVFEITCFTDSTADDNDASILAEKTRTSLLLPSIRSLLQAASVGVFDPGPVQYIPQVVAVKFRGRAVVAIRCYVPAQSVIEYMTYIQTVNGQVSVSGASPNGFPIVKPFTTIPPS